MANSDRTLDNYLRYNGVSDFQNLYPHIGWIEYSSIWSTWQPGPQPRLCSSCHDASHLEGGPYPSRSCQLPGGLSSRHNPLRFKQIKVNSSKFKHIHANSCKFMQIHANSCKFMQIHANSFKFMQIHANSCKFMQIQANSSKFKQIQGISVEFKQIQANSSKYKQIQTN